MDVGGIVAPVDHPGVEAEGGLVLRVESVPAGEEAVDAVDGLALGIGAVQLDVGQRPLHLLPLGLEGGGPGRLLSPEWQRLQRLLPLDDGALRSFELALDPSSAGERPLRDDDGLALGVEDRVVREERADHVHEVAVAERVD